MVPTGISAANLSKSAIKLVLTQIAETRSWKQLPEYNYENYEKLIPILWSENIGKVEKLGRNEKIIKISKIGKHAELVVSRSLEQNVQIDRSNKSKMWRICIDNKQTGRRIEPTTTTFFDENGFETGFNLIAEEKMKNIVLQSNFYVWNRLYPTCLCLSTW